MPVVLCHNESVIHGGQHLSLFQRATNVRKKSHAKKLVQLLLAVSILQKLRTAILHATELSQFAEDKFIASLFFYYPFRFTTIVVAAWNSQRMEPGPLGQTALHPL